MTIEALISVRRKGDRGAKSRGDVLAVRPQDSLWGVMETRFHLVVDWTDAALESQLDNLPAENRVIVHPYASRDPKGRVAVRSTRYLDIGTLSSRLLADVLDEEMHVDKLFTNQYTKRTR